MADRHPARVVLGLDARNGFVATDGWLNTSATKATDLARDTEGKLKAHAADADADRQKWDRDRKGLRAELADAGAARISYGGGPWQAAMAWLEDQARPAINWR